MSNCSFDGDTLPQSLFFPVQYWTRLLTDRRKKPKTTIVLYCRLNVTFSTPKITCGRRLHKQRRGFQNVNVASLPTYWSVDCIVGSSTLLLLEILHLLTVCTRNVHTNCNSIWRQYVLSNASVTGFSSPIATITIGVGNVFIFLHLTSSIVRVVHTRCQGRKFPHVKHSIQYAHNMNYNIMNYGGYFLLLGVT